MVDRILTTFDRVPETPRGYVRDIRVRWALEEARLPYRVESVPFRARNAEHFSHQPEVLLMDEPFNGSIAEDFAAELYACRPVYVQRHLWIEFSCSVSNGGLIQSRTCVAERRGQIDELPNARNRTCRDHAEIDVNDPGRSQYGPSVQALCR